MEKEMSLTERFISYGIAKSEEDVSTFMGGAYQTYILMCDEEEPTEEGMVSFSCGFGEGAIYSQIAIINRLLELGYSYAKIQEITNASFERIQDIESAMREFY